MDNLAATHILLRFVPPALNPEELDSLCIPEFNLGLGALPQPTTTKPTGFRQIVVSLVPLVVPHFLLWVEW
jgi:hypothetical protein